MKEFSVLIPSAGRRVALLRLCRKNLEELGISGQVIAIDMSELSSAYHSADRAFLVPPCSSRDFVASVFDLAREHSIGLVIPTIDYGPMNIQIFHDADSGALNVVEINPRFGGGYPLTEAAGGLYIRWILEELLELDSTLDSNLWTDGLVMLRFDDGVFIPSSALESET